MLFWIQCRELREFRPLYFGAKKMRWRICGISLLSEKYQSLKFNDCNCPNLKDNANNPEEDKYSSWKNRVDLSKVDASKSVIEIITCSICFESIDRHNNWSWNICSKVWCASWLQRHITLLGCHCPNWRIKLNYPKISTNRHITSLLSELEYKKDDNYDKKICSKHKLEFISFWKTCSESKCFKCILQEQNCISQKHDIVSSTQLQEDIDTLGSVIEESDRLYELVLLEKIKDSTFDKWLKVINKFTGKTETKEKDRDMINKYLDDKK